MRRQVVKEKVIHTTAQLITRYGIRQVRVDEIAQQLGISKRTLYELFHDKTELINCCLEKIKEQHHNRIISYLDTKNENPLQRAFWLMTEFIGNLYSVDCEFLAELRHKPHYAEKYQENKLFWQTQFDRILQEGQREGYVLADTNTNHFANWMMVSMLESRLDGLVRNEQEEFCRIALRGISTRKGIEWIDTQHVQKNDSPTHIHPESLPNIPADHTQAQPRH